MNSDYFCLFGSIYGFIYQQAIPPRELRMRNANPRPAGEAEETGLGASVFRFSKHETPREMHWSVSRNETPAKNRVSFLLFHSRRVSTLALVVDSSALSPVKRLRHQSSAICRLGWRVSGIFFELQITL